MKNLDELHVCIVGLGLMGGSLALALRDSVSKITAVDVNSQTLEKALARKIVDRASTSLEDGISAADVVVLATPVRTILAAIKQLSTLQVRSTIFTDLGSTKVDVVAAMNRLPSDFEAIGAHPMCGRERSGLEAADRELFQGKNAVLCRTERTTERAQQTVTNLFKAAGANIVVMDAEDHDRSVAVTSHLPYLLAGALSQVTAEMATENDQIWDLAASGFADMTRLSGSDPGMMYDILVTNRNFIVQALSKYVSQIDGVLEHLSAKDDNELKAWQNAGKRDYSLYRSH